MASYNEWARPEGQAIGYHPFGLQVPIHHKQMVPAGRAGVDNRPGGIRQIGIGEDRYTGERRDESASERSYIRLNMCDIIVEGSEIHRIIPTTHSRQYISGTAQ